MPPKIIYHHWYLSSFSLLHQPDSHRPPWQEVVPHRDSIMQLFLIEHLSLKFMILFSTTFNLEEVSEIAFSTIKQAPAGFVKAAKHHYHLFFTSPYLNHYQ